MERRDDDGSLAGDPGGNPPSRCDRPTGASPVSVSAEAPSSRPAASGEIRWLRPGDESERGSEKLLSEEQVRGPQHQVKLAASTDEQSESRAGHVTAKATATSPDSERDGALGGVGRAARVQGGSRNTREPSARPLSRQGASNRPKAKGSVAQRKSEGVIVPTMTATKNAVGGKGFKGGHVDEEGTREGMAGRTGPNHPARKSDKVQELRRRLWVAAKQSPERRFHALHDHMWRRDVLREAWKRVKKRRGSAGLDAQSISDVARYGVELFLEEIAP